MIRKKSKPARIHLAPKNKCRFCRESKCCRYITQEIRTPRSCYDFEHIMWQVLHCNVEVFKDADKTWYLLMNTTCSKLLPDGRCSIYKSRPEICREHNNDWCEYDEAAEDHWLLHFRDFESINKYGKKRFKRWGQSK